MATSVGGGGREDASRVDSVRGGLGGTACDAEAEASGSVGVGEDAAKIVYASVLALKD